MTAPGAQWTPEEDELLRSIGAAGESVATIATLLKRSPTQCASGPTHSRSSWPVRRQGGKRRGNSSYMGNRWRPQEERLFRRMGKQTPVNKRPRLTPPSNRKPRSPWTGARRPSLGRSIAWLADRRRDPTPIDTRCPERSGLTPEAGGIKNNSFRDETRLPRLGRTRQ
jgi:hypothetical protein